MADRFVSRRYSLKNKLGDRMIKQLLNSVIAKYRDLSVSRRSIICLSLRLRQIIDLLATEKSRYFAQPRPIIANYYCNEFTFLLIGFTKQEMVQEMSCSLDFVYCTSYIKSISMRKPSRTRQGVIMLKSPI